MSPSAGDGEKDTVLKRSLMSSLASSEKENVLGSFCVLIVKAGSAVGGEARRHLAQTSRVPVRLLMKKCVFNASTLAVTHPLWRTTLI